MRKILITVENSWAHCPELGLTGEGADLDASVRDLHQRIRRMLGGEVLIVLPYMGQDFSPRWEDLRLKPPPKEDEYEEAQKAYEFSREKEIP